MDYLYERNRGVAATPARDARRRSPRRASTSSSSAAATPAPTASATRSARARCRVTQLELLPEPPTHRPDDRTPWPLWPQKYRLSYAMEEAQAVGKGEQDFSIVTTRFAGEDGRVTALHYAQADAPPFGPVAGTEGELQADLVLLAMGFLHPEHEGCSSSSASPRTSAATSRPPTYETSVAGRLRRRRRAPRPVADRLGDQRGPPGRPHVPTATSARCATSLRTGQRRRRRRGPRGPAEPRLRRHARRGRAGIAPMGALMLDELSWPQVRAELDAGRDTVVMALGATEQHGPHMPLATDALLGGHMARRVADRLDDSSPRPSGSGAPATISSSRGRCR